MLRIPKEHPLEHLSYAVFCKVIIIIVIVLVLLFSKYEKCCTASLVFENSECTLAY